MTTTLEIEFRDGKIVTYDDGTIDYEKRVIFITGSDGLTGFVPFEAVFAVREARRIEKAVQEK